MQMQVNESGVSMPDAILVARSEFGYGAISRADRIPIFSWHAILSSAYSLEWLSLSYGPLRMCAIFFYLTPIEPPAPAPWVKRHQWLRNFPERSRDFLFSLAFPVFSFPQSFSEAL